MINVPENQVDIEPGRVPTSASEAKYPLLWQRLVGAWVPQVSRSGILVHDVSPTKNHAWAYDTGTKGDPGGVIWRSKAIGRTVEPGTEFGDGMLAGVPPASVRGANKRSMFAWLRLDGTGNGDDCIMHYGDEGGGSAGAKWTFRLNSGNLRLEVNSGGSNSSLNIADDKWHMVGYELRGNTLNDATVYRDLDSEGLSNSQTINTSDAHGVALLSESDFGRKFDGRFHSMYLFAGVLPASLRLLIYRDPLAPLRLSDEMVMSEFFVPAATGGAVVAPWPVLTTMMGAA